MTNPPAPLASPAQPRSAKAKPDRGPLVLACCLAALAGWIDGIGFVHWHGLFVSFMSGNTTQTGAAVGSDWPAAIRSARVIIAFVVGVLAGELIAALGGMLARPTVLAVEAALLWLGVGGSAAGWGDASLTSLLGLAMGIQNASVHEADGISVALTYVTGTLVKVGRGIAAAMIGSERWTAIVPYAGLWFALLCGALAGANVSRISEPAALVAAASACTVSAVLTAISSRRRQSACLEGPDQAMRSPTAWSTGPAPGGTEATRS